MKTNPTLYCFVGQPNTVFSSVYARVEPFQAKDENKLRFRFRFQALNLVGSKNKMTRRLKLASEPTTVLEIARPHDTPSVQTW